MASGRGERALAAQGSERPLGESTSIRDVTEMRRRVPSPLGTGKLTLLSPSERETASTPSPSPVTLKTSRKVYNRAVNLTGDTLGPTRAMLDVRKRRIRQNRAEKLQLLNSAKQEVEKLQAGVSDMFEELESTLLTHPAHPLVHVQSCKEEFNVKSTQLQQLQKKISVMKNELQLIDKMLNRRSEYVPPRQKMTTCTTSKQFCSSTSDPIPEVCGFPVYHNPYHQLFISESHADGQISEIIPEGVKKSNEAVIPLLDPRRNRTQILQSENRESVNPVAEPIISVQDKEDSVLVSSVQNITEQATGLKISVPVQSQNQTSNQSMQGMSSTDQSVCQYSDESAHKGAVQSAHTGAILQEHIPLLRPTIEVNPRCPPNFNGKFREDISRWISYMGNYLTFMQGTPDQ